jgi:hypothetical protein
VNTKHNWRGVLKLVAAAIICSCLPGFSQTTNSFFQFVISQNERQYTQVPHEVLAFYYPWYGQPSGRDPWHGYDTNKHEIFGAQRYPVKGPYSSHDLSVIDWQIDLAKAHVSKFYQTGGSRVFIRDHTVIVLPQIFLR